mmetsp:Transcript_10716/g.35485  ORF Transcript_10716/g.35485 Transcript_10716/m.35485 type:complete len:353 (-) Transcript_10716:1166-2224(-)
MTITITDRPLGSIDPDRDQSSSVRTFYTKKKKRVLISLSLKLVELARYSVALRSSRRSGAGDRRRLGLFFFFFGWWCRWCGDFSRWSMEPVAIVVQAKGDDIRGRREEEVREFASVSLEEAVQPGEGRRVDAGSVAEEGGAVVEAEVGVVRERLVAFDGPRGSLGVFFFPREGAEDGVDDGLPVVEEGPLRDDQELVVEALGASQLGSDDAHREEPVERPEVLELSLFFERGEGARDGRGEADIEGLGQTSVRLRLVASHLGLDRRLERRRRRQRPTLPSGLPDLEAPQHVVMAEGPVHRLAKQRDPRRRRPQGRRRAYRRTRGRGRGTDEQECRTYARGRRRSRGRGGWRP